MNYTYVTLATTERYLDGAEFLYQSLKNVGSVYPLLVLVTDNVPTDIIERKKNNGINYLTIPYYFFNKIDNVEYDLSLNYYDRYKDTINKFQCFNLIEYDKIIFLDADLFLYDNIDFLFDIEIDFPFIPSYDLKTLKVDGASFIIKPDKNIFPSLLKKEKFIYAGNDEEATITILPDYIKIDPETLQPRIIDPIILLENYHIPKYALHLPGEKKYWEFISKEEINLWKEYDKYKMREIGEELYLKSIIANE